MKNQYFADINDYFKYDLCIFLAENLPKIQRFTFIPTLTPNDRGPDGNKTRYPMGVGRESLYKFLQQCLDGRERKVSLLREYFQEQKADFKFEYCPYGDTLDLEFTHSGREEYFNNISDEYLQSAVIMVDPDNGFEVKVATPSKFHKYIKYSEARDLYERMDSNSVLVIYQHFPMIKRQVFLNTLHARLQDELQCLAPVTVFSSSIALVMLTKNAAGRKDLHKQASRYPRRELKLHG